MAKPTRWILWFGPALVLGLAATWWFARGPESAGLPRDGAGALAHKAKKHDPREGEVLKLAREKGSDAGEKLVAFYGRLANDPSALGVRALALGALFSEPSRALRLKRVLEAVVADPTPARNDPLWPELVGKLAEQWTPEVFDKGRDLMLMEKRPRAQRALVASFVEFAMSGQIATLSPERRNALLTDLIDVHGLVEPDQRPDIQGAVGELGGNDAALLLSGQGLNGGQKLQAQLEYERQLQIGMNALMKDPPNLNELHR